MVLYGYDEGNFVVFYPFDLCSVYCCCLCHKRNVAIAKAVHCSFQLVLVFWIRLGGVLFHRLFVTCIMSFLRPLEPPHWVFDLLLRSLMERKRLTSKFVF